MKKMYEDNELNIQNFIDEAIENNTLLHVAFDSARVHQCFFTRVTGVINTDEELEIYYLVDGEESYMSIVKDYVTEVAIANEAGMSIAFDDNSICCFYSMDGEF